MRVLQMRGYAAFAVACLTLTHCAIVDQYADRATTYNLEAEEAQEKGILLNIVRSSLRRPLQFTSVTSIIGGTSATGGGGLSAPVNVPFRASGGAGSYPVLNTWTAAASMSGSETFTVPVLDTQEFYQGILKPLPSQFYDLLVQQRYPSDLLFNLFIQKVVMRRTAPGCDKGNHTETCEHTFINYVSNDDQVDEFQMFSHFLIRAGLTTEAADARKDSLLKGAMNINLKLLGSSTPAGVSGQGSGGAASGSSQSTEPLPKNYVFCFAPKNQKYIISPSARCGAIQKGGNPAGGEQSPSTLTLEKSPAGVVGALPECSANDPRYAEFCALMTPFVTAKNMSLSFYTKSTEAVIYYLGEVARRQLYPDQFRRDTKLRSIMITTAQDQDIQLAPCDMLPEAADPNYCQYLFRIDNGLIAPPGSLSVIYGGDGYSVPDYRHGGGYSMSSLEIAKQLLALFSSAKTLPSTTVLSVVNQ